MSIEPSRYSMGRGNRINFTSGPRGRRRRMLGAAVGSVAHAQTGSVDNAIDALGSIERRQITGRRRRRRRRRS